MGGASSATKKQQAVTLEASEQQLAFNTQLMSLFQSQYATQKSTLDFLQGVLKPVITQAEAGQGYSTAELNAMRTSANDTLSENFQNAQAALNQTLKTSGDANVPSGVTAGADAALLNSEAIAKSQAQNAITVQNAEVARSNLFGAVNALQGNAAQVNPLGYSSAATGGSGTIAGLGNAQSNLQNAITSANSNSFFGKLGGSLATSLGSGIGSALTGGLGTGVSMLGSGNFGW